MGFLRRMMYGRYGSDQLSIFLMLVYLVLGFFRNAVLSYVSLALLVVTLFRIFSRNIPKRRAENAKFLTIFAPILKWIKFRTTVLTDKDHRYFKCPSCGQQLRVPRGKGTLNIKCRNCGVSFEKKS